MCVCSVSVISRHCTDTHILPAVPRLRGQNNLLINMHALSSGSDTQIDRGYHFPTAILLPVLTVCLQSNKTLGNLVICLNYLSHPGFQGQTVYTPPSNTLMTVPNWGSQTLSCCCSVSTEFRTNKFNLN